MICAVCGECCTGKQWWNRDTGFGLCAKCYKWMKGRGESEDDIKNLYGVKGEHFMVDYRESHTPGPWSQFDNGGSTASGHEYGDRYADVVWGPKGPGYGSIADCSPNGQPPTEESVANARLIAAAPDMLDALKALRQSYKNADFWNAHKLMIDAIIAKAEGKE